MFLEAFIGLSYKFYPQDNPIVAIETSHDDCNNLTLIHAYLTLWSIHIGNALDMLRCASKLFVNILHTISMLAL